MDGFLKSSVFDGVTAGRRPRAWRHAEMAAASSMRRACRLAFGLGGLGLDAQARRQVGLAEAERLVEEAARFAGQLRRGARRRRAACARRRPAPRAASRSAVRRSRSSASWACDLGRFGAGVGASRASCRGPPPKGMRTPSVMVCCARLAEGHRDRAWSPASARGWRATGSRPARRFVRRRRLDPCSSCSAACASTSAAAAPGSGSAWSRTLSARGGRDVRPAHADADGPLRERPRPGPGQLRRSPRRRRPGAGRRGPDRRPWHAVATSAAMRRVLSS